MQIEAKEWSHTVYDVLNLIRRQKLKETILWVWFSNFSFGFLLISLSLKRKLYPLMDNKTKWENKKTDTERERDRKAMKNLLWFFHQEKREKKVKLKIKSS